MPRTDESRPLPIRDRRVGPDKLLFQKATVAPKRPEQVNIRADADLHDGLDAIAKATKIRNRSDIVRYAVAQTAKRLKK